MPEPAYGNLGWTENREAAPLAPGLRRIPARANSKLVPRLVFAVIVLYALTFAYLGARQHLSLQTNAGLGIVDQAVGNTLEGRPFAASVTSEAESRLAVHVEPILLAVAQLYRLAPSPITLLAIQAVVVSLGALPAFWLARERLGHDMAGMVFAAAYLLTPSLGTANPADFSPVAMAGSFLLFAFWLAFRGHFFGFSPFALWQ